MSGCKILSGHLHLVAEKVKGSNISFFISIGAKKAMSTNVLCTAERHRLRELDDCDVVVEVEEVESRVADAHLGVDGHPAVVLTVDQVATSLDDNKIFYNASFTYVQFKMTFFPQP